MSHIRTGLWALALATAGTVHAGDAPPISDASPLTAAQLVAAVLERNPGLAGLRAAVEAAGERVPQAGALDDPMLMTKLAPASVGDGSPGYMLELSQRLPWPGKRAARAELAARERDALAAEADVLRLELAAEVRSLFADYRGATEALAVNTRNRALGQELAAVAESLYRAGKASRQDALAAALAWRGLEREQLARSRALDTLKARLNRLLAQAQGAPLPEPAAMELPPHLPALDVLEERALKRHPSLASHAAHLHAAQQAVRLAELNDYPDFEVRAGYDRFWDEAPMRGTVALSINLPLGGDRAAGKREAHAQARSSEWALADRRNQLRETLAGDLAVVREALAALRLQEHKLLPLARENLDAALAEYRAGTGDFLRVAEAQRALAESELARVEAEAALIRTWADLERDSGGADVVAEALAAAEEGTR